MNPECRRIADQLRRAFAGAPWHGPSLQDLLNSVTPKQAMARPLASAHSVWELVLHIQVWAHAGFEVIRGTPLPKLYGTEKDWPAVADSSAAAWMDAKDSLFQTASQLALAIEQFSDDRLKETVPGRNYDFYYLFHGIVQHSLYHGGQIALLKKAPPA